MDGVALRRDEVGDEPGAIVAALLTALGVGWVSKRAALRLDTSIGILFAGAFAAGLLLISTIKGYVGDLMSFLFGNVLAVTTSDLVVVAVLSLFVVVALGAMYKQLLFATFDPLGAQAAGYPVGLLECALLVLVALAIAVSIQVVGIILLVAMLVTPAATAQLLTRRFASLIALAVLLSVIESLVGIRQPRRPGLTAVSTAVVSCCYKHAALGLMRESTGIFLHDALVRCV